VVLLWLLFSEKRRGRSLRAGQRSAKEYIMSRTVQAFTLIELLLVMVILAILAAVVVPNLTKRPDQAKEAATKAELASLKTAIGMFQLDNGRWPRTDEGLGALLACPTDLEESWKGPYIEGGVPTDKWGHPYRYVQPGTRGQFDLSSDGRDGQQGTDDDLYALAPG
jgi:general secretion pathway protein G